MRLSRAVLLFYGVGIGLAWFHPLVLADSETSTTNQQSVQPDQDTSDWNIFRDQRYQFEFKYPSFFVVGSFKQDPTSEFDAEEKEVLEQGGYNPDEMLFKDNVVLVEQSLLGQTPSTAIPIGEVSTIDISPVTKRSAAGELADRFSTKLPPSLQKQELSIGSHQVSKYPAGVPGPYGGASYFYVVRMSDTLLLEFTGHRERFSHLVTLAEPTPSQYDLLIEQIIRTSKLTR